MALAIILLTILYQNHYFYMCSIYSGITCHLLIKGWHIVSYTAPPLSPSPLSAINSGFFRLSNDTSGLPAFRLYSPPLHGARGAASHASCLFAAGYAMCTASFISGLFRELC